jgi:hypothetical protein
MHKLIGFGRAGIAMNSFYKAACIAFITAPLAHGQLTMTAQPTSPNSGSVFHCGTDYVILEQGRRAAHATPFGYEFLAPERGSEGDCGKGRSNNVARFRGCQQSESGLLTDCQPKQKSVIGGGHPALN